MSLQESESEARTVRRKTQEQPMSQENVARQAIHPRGRRRRSLDEELMVRVPSVSRLIGPAIQ
jgi:hypothetical protein